VFLDVSPHVNSVPTAFAGDPSQPGLGVLKLEQTGQRVQITPPFLFGQIQQVLPNVGELGQLAIELEREVNVRSGLAVTESFPSSIRQMRFGPKQ
jgi:hypothetical protein